jgi:cell wall-associated NlpC family hydrolase
MLGEILYFRVTMNRNWTYIWALQATGVLFIVAVLGACSPGPGREASGISHLLDSLGQVYAPDPRIALWEFSISGKRRDLFLEGEVADEAAFRELLRLMDRHFPQAEVRVILLPEGKGQGFVNGLVNNSVAHLRAGPSGKSEMITQVLLGTPVRILKEEGGWRYIQVPDGYLGWVSGHEVWEADTAQVERYGKARKCVFTGTTGSSFTEPDEGTLPVSDLLAGCILLVVDERKDFLQVEYPDGRKGWVNKQQTLPAAFVLQRSPEGEELVRTALQFNGIPYLWGGKSPKAFDCSGFTSTVFYLNGWSLPRDADQQSRCGKVVTIAYDSGPLLAGDLLFFGSTQEGAREGKVTHVAMYMRDSEFIHASGYRDRVGINSMDSTRADFIESYPDLFIRAVRIIRTEGGDQGPVSENRYYKEILK